MKFWRVMYAVVLFAAVTYRLAAQTPALSSLEAPYAALQGTSIQLAGHVYGAGQVAYGPVGTPLVITGTNFGQSGAVRFVSYVNGSIDTNSMVNATTTLWQSNLIEFSVPAGAASGLVFVINSNGTSNGLPFVVTPGAYSGSCPASPPGSQLQITTSSLSSGTVGTTYSVQLQSTGGTGTKSWSIVSGTLPNGISLNGSDGTLSGTPTAAASVQITARVADSGSPQQTDSAIFDLTISPQSSGMPLYGFAISSGSTSGYDAAGNIVAYTDSVTGTWDMTTGGYDNLNRLTATQATAGPYQGLQASWSYDGFGNRTLENFGGTLVNQSPPPIPGSTAFSYNNYNQIQTANPAPAPTYDTGGNVVRDSENQYAYDGEGRLCAVYDGLTRTSTGYLYDAEGNRVAKGTIQWVMVNGVSTLSCDTTQNSFTATTAYVRGPGGDQLSELTNNTGAWNWAHTNVYAAGQLAATYDADASGQTEGSLYFHLADWLGTRRESTDYSGIPCATYTSLPYGTGLFPSSGPCLANSQDPTEHHFTGKERDAESGNDYFGARYYSSAMGRFLSPDPLGNQVADFSNPQTWNMYSYAVNNPLKFVDPTGTDWCAWDDGTHDDDPNGPGGTSQDESQQNCAKDGGTWIPTLNQSVSVNGDTGDAVYTSDVWVTPTIQPQQQSYWGCVRGGLQDFSLQSGLQNISGGKLGNGWLAGAFLGNSIQSAGDFIQQLASGKPGSAAKTAATEGTSWAAAPAATAAASKVPNVAVSVGVQVAATVQTPTASATVSLSAQAAADIPLGTVAQAGAGVLSKALGALGTVKLPYDLSVASFSAVVCGIGR